MEDPEGPRLLVKPKRKSTKKKTKPQKAAAAVDRLAALNKEQFQLFKKMEYFLKPYYKDYYSFKEHMDFSESEARKSQQDEPTPPSLPTPRESGSWVQVQRSQSPPSLVEGDETYGSLGKDADCSPIERKSSDGGGSDIDQNWAKVAKFILKVKGGEF